MHPIIKAIEDDVFEDFTSLINEHPEYLSVLDEDGWNLLPLSVQYNMPEFTDFLLSKLTNEEIIKSQPAHPFIIALNNQNNKAAEQIMLHPNVDPNTTFKNNETALFYSTFVDNNDLSNILLNRNADPFIKNKQGHTAINNVIKKGNVNLFNVFKKSPQFKQEFNNLWISNSIGAGNSSIFNKLLPYFKGNIDELFDYAYSTKQIEILASIIDHSSFIPGTKQINCIVEIMCNVYSNPKEQESAVKLADYLFEINTPFTKFVNSEGQNAWMLAIQNNNDLIFSRLVNETEDSVNFVDNMNNTPLFYAIEKKSIKFIKDLLEIGADVNHLDNNEDTPLIKAARLGNLEMVNEILLYHPRVNEINKKGESALSISVLRKQMDISAKLLWHGGEITINPGKFLDRHQVQQIGFNGHYEFLGEYVEEKTINNFIALVQLGFNIKDTNEEGDTFLLHFIKNGYLANFQALIPCIKDGNHVDNNNNSALMCAMEKNLDLYAEIMLFKIKDLNLDIVNNQGKNVFDLCLSSGSLPKLEKLLSYKNDILPENALKVIFFLSEKGSLSKHWDKLKTALPNLETLMDNNNNSLLMLAAKGGNKENFEFLANQNIINFSSDFRNNNKHGLIDIIDQLPIQDAEYFIDIFSHNIVNSKKKKSMTPLPQKRIQLKM